MYKRGYTQPYKGVLSLSFTDSEHSARGALDEHADKRHAFIRRQMHELVRTAHTVGSLRSSADLAVSVGRAIAASREPCSALHFGPSWTQQTVAVYSVCTQTGGERDGLAWP